MLASQEDLEQSLSNDDDDNSSGGYCDTVRRILAKFKILTPFIIVILYSLIGAGMFIALERENDVENRRSKKIEIETARNSTIASIMNSTNILLLDNLDKEIYITEAIMSYEESVGFSYSENTVWTFWNALLYAGTIYTTIGYGNIACATFGGRLATIFYAIIGIPLALTTLNDLGKLLLNLITKISKLFHRFRFKWASRKRRRQRTSSTLEEGEREPEVVTLDPWGSAIPETGDGGEATEEDDPPPVAGAVFATISWLFICAGLFMGWEDWDYFTSFYFFFVSLSTIGFGDVVPAYPEYMVMMFALVFVGLALVSVCIGVVQQKLEEMYMALLLTLLKEYIQMMESGQNELGASIGMAQMWSKNKKAKFLLPLLGKDKRNIVMQKFQDEAKAHNIELPAAFTSVDKKSGLPAIVKAVEKEKVEEWAVKVEEEQIQKTMAPPIEEPQELPPMQSTASQPDTRHMTSQTSLNVYAESEQQTYSSSFQLREATSQTALFELQHRHMQTASSLFQLREAMSQTAIRELEARAMQTLSSLSLQQDMGSQTIIKLFQEQPIQTLASYFHSKENESQTLSTVSQDTQSQTNLSSFQTKSGGSQTYSSFTGTKDSLTQSVLSSFAMKNCDSQTDIRANIHSISQTDLSAFQRKDYSGQTIERQLNETVSQTDISSLSTTDFGSQTLVVGTDFGAQTLVVGTDFESQTIAMGTDFESQTIAMGTDFGSQTFVAGTEQFAQTEVQQNFFASQTDLSSFLVNDSDSQTFLATEEHGLQHGSSLAELTSVALQASCSQNDSTSQTLMSTFQMRAAQSQTALDTMEVFSQTISDEPHLTECQSQTELNVRENENQTSISFFKLRNVDSQTFVDASDQSLQTVYEVDESESQTFLDTSEESSQVGSEFFRLKHTDSQTTLIMEEATVQTLSSFFDVQHFGSQVSLQTENTQVQTDDTSSSTMLPRPQVDQCLQANIKDSQIDVGVQTGILQRVEHLISKKLGKSKEAETKDSYILTKRKSLKKVKPSTLSDDEGQGRRSKNDGQSSSDEETVEKGENKLLWTALDGRHVEKQQPVSALKKKFEKQGTRESLKPVEPDTTKDTGKPKKLTKRRSSADFT